MMTAEQPEIHRRVWLSEWLDERGNRKEETGKRPRYELREKVNGGGEAFKYDMR